MKRILVIEDDPTVRDIILEVLALDGFEAAEAANGLIGIQVATEKKPDLILCDVMMPEMDGYTVLKTLRQNPATATIPFIFLTAKASKDALRQGMDLGADDYLTKPFTASELLRAIAVRLEKQGAIAQQYQEKLDDLRESITLSLPHELRTPLHGLLGLSELVLNSADHLDRDEILSMVRDMQNSAKQLERLIQNFLLYADLEIVATDPQRIKALRSGQGCYAKLVITAAARQTAQKVGRETDLHLNLQDVSVQMSIPRLKKVVEELVDNACKFSEPGTSIHISSQLSGQTCMLAIADQGRGMTPEQIADLGAYRQFERKLYEQQGSGLGLTLAKRLVELHGGKLTLESQIGQHTTVRLSLPSLPL